MTTTTTITSLNANGIRSAASKGLENWLARTAPDALCVQELKAQMPDIEKAGLLELAGMKGYFCPAQKKGYSGVAIYTKHEPSEVRLGFDGGEFDAEGRWIELRFDTPQRKFSLVSSYFPSGSSGDERQAAKFRYLAAVYPHIQQAAQGRDFLLCGDINIAHQEIDLKNWKGNLKNSGFLPEERAWMTQLLDNAASAPLQDVYRQLHPSSTDESYTWWSQRGQAWAKNVGWRIDYHLASPALARSAQSAHIEKTERFSDHAPLTVQYAAGF
ncbi:MAG: exodeoxyribonuclease III [Brachymonas sp.]